MIISSMDTEDDYSSHLGIVIGRMAHGSATYHDTIYTPLGNDACRGNIHVQLTGKYRWPCTQTIAIRWIRRS